MSKIYVFITIVFLLPSITFAQISNVVFIGSVSVEGGATYPYKLYVTDSNDVLYGHSITDIGGPNETKTRVRGSVNATKNQLTFKEKSIIYTHTKGKVDFCFIHARLKAGKIQGASTLKGSFTGYKEDGKTECAKGKIMLVCANDALDKLMKYAEEHNIPRPNDTLEPATDDTLEKIILPGGAIKLPVTSNNVNIELWDAMDIDGDVITLMQGSNVLLHKYALTDSHKTLSINIDNSKKTALRLIAESEGARPLNTTHMIVSTPNESFTINATTVMGKDVKIIIEEKKKN